MQGRIFDFGNKKSRDGGVDVSVGSGVPCGIAARRGVGSKQLPPRGTFWPCCACAACACLLPIQAMTSISAVAGADIDALGFVFLRRAVSSVLTDVTYSGIPTNEVRRLPFPASQGL
jgi:hypothetical protein